MAAPRKIFRIEEMSGSRLEPRQGEAPAPLRNDTMQEPSALRALLASASPAMAAQAAAAHDDEILRLTTQLRVIRSAIGAAPQPRSADAGTEAAPAARVASELATVIGDSEVATQKILAAAEDIDQAANDLSATLKGNFEHGLAQDIRERVIKIFEACNFQDVTSQRVAKVLAAFAGLEQQVIRAQEALTRLPAAPPLHGPGLPGEPGHISQGDVDALFDGSARST
jgi:chemotaxis protein CheZ